MSVEIAYLDSSAFVKTINEELESRALARFLVDWPRRASSKLLLVESLRVARRYAPEKLGRTRGELRSVQLIEIDDGVLERATSIDPVTVRSLDAIHLATAEQLGSDLGVVVTYDERMASGARMLGLAVASPS